MNQDLQRKLVATHERVDPALVTAEDLVRAIRQNTVIVFAAQLGQSIEQASWPNAVRYIANLITLPTPADNRVVWRGEMPEPLPFSEGEPCST